MRSSTPSATSPWATSSDCWRWTLWSLSGNSPRLVLRRRWRTTKCPAWKWRAFLIQVHAIRPRIKTGLRIPRRSWRKLECCTISKNRSSAALLQKVRISAALFQRIRLVNFIRGSKNRKMNWGVILRRVDLLIWKIEVHPVRVVFFYENYIWNESLIYFSIVVVNHSHTLIWRSDLFFTFHWIFISIDFLPFFYIVLLFLFKFIHSLILKIRVTLPVGEN